MNEVVISIIIPSYLEEENLRLILPRLNTTLTNLAHPYEVFVIDTMQMMDNTKDVCILNNVSYLPRENGNNYGDAIRTGIKYVQGAYTIIMDADGSHSPEFIKSLYDHIDKYDLIIASRYISGGSTDNNKILIFFSFITNLSYSIILNLDYRDISNSYRLYKSCHLKELNLKCKNFDIVEEILFKIKKKHNTIKILEIPYSFKERMFGHTKRNLLIFAITYIITILRLRFDL